MPCSGQKHLLTKLPTMKTCTRFLMTAFFLAALAPALPAQQTADSSVVKMNPFSVTEIHDDPLLILPGAALDGAFGMKQSVFDTPRALTVITAEMMDRYNVQDINDLVKISPGTFTTSFYGIAGQIDVRGTPGETYFRGMKRIENPGNYPTPIAASDRIDIVRGPPSPIYGAGKVGGYLDFQPKSSRAETGRYLDEEAGVLTATYGSWDKKITTAEVGGSGLLMGKRAGYYAYVQDENDGSYYRNGFVNQTIVQTTFDLELTPKIRVEMGEQYQYWKGTENAGWNRVTQALVDNGTYLAGHPLLNLDTNGDGAISPAEATAAGGLSATWVYGTAAPVLGQQYALDPASVHLVHLSGSDVLIDSVDDALSKSFCTFFDVIDNVSDSLKISNKIFTDYLDRNKHASYGFSQYQNAFSFEDKVVAEQTLQPTSWLKMENAFCLDYRYYDVAASADSFFELAQRRDLSVGGTANDRTTLSFFNAGLNPWGSWVQSTYEDYGVGALSNMHFADKANLLVGVRSDYLNFYAHNAPNLRTGSNLRAWAFKKPIGYSGSFSYDITPWLKPYITYGHQPTPVIGQAGEVTVGSLQANPLYNSELREVGIKSELLEKKLFTAVDIYRQNRSSFDTITNSIVAYTAQGFETELRYAPTKEFSLTGAATLQKTYYLPLVAKTVFSTPLLTGNDPASAYAGDQRATLPATGFFEERPGQPDRILSLFGTYLFDSGFGFTLGGVYTAKVSAGSSEIIQLPSSMVYTTTLTYQLKRWRFKLAIDNLTNLRYFHSLSPDSFGDFTVLPEPPRSWAGSVAYRF